MKRLFSHFAFILFVHGASAQNVDVARGYFDVFEYEKAAKSYEAIPKNWLISVEDKQKWCYSNFASANYQKAMSLADTLIVSKNAPAYFYYIHGVSAMAIGKYDQAIRSLTDVKSLDKELFVDSLIASCQLLPTFKAEEHKSFAAMQINRNKADYPGVMLNEGFISFHEFGKEGRKLKDLELVDDADLLQMTPYINKGGQQLKIQLPDDLKYHSVSSIAFADDNQTVFITLSNPIDQLMENRYHRLYTATLNEQAISNIRLWEHANVEGFASAHATINQSKNLMVFVGQSVKDENADLYLSRLENGEWSKPILISEINTVHDELYPKFNGDSLLTFSSNGRVGYGGYDIYGVQVDVNGNWGTIKHFKEPINSFSDDYHYIYFPTGDSAILASNRKGTDDDDIFLITFEKTPEPIEPEEEIKPDDFHDYEDIIVYFGFDKFSLTEENRNRVLALKERFNEVKHFKIVVEGHTDIRGNERYNYELALKRATQVKTEMLNLGLDDDKIEVVSVGSTKPAIDCKRNCTEKEHALNRFVAIKVVPN